VRAVVGPHRLVAEEDDGAGEAAAAQGAGGGGGDVAGADDDQGWFGHGAHPSVVADSAVVATRGVTGRGSTRTAPASVTWTA
jgi:hypothetical protein